MKFVRGHKSNREDIYVYWIKQRDPLTLADFSTVHVSTKFSFSTWWKLQKYMMALWLVGKDWSFEDGLKVFE